MVYTGVVLVLYCRYTGTVGRVLVYTNGVLSLLVHTSAYPKILLVYTSVVLVLYCRYTGTVGKVLVYTNGVLVLYHCLYWFFAVCTKISYAYWVSGVQGDSVGFW